MTMCDENDYNDLPEDFTPSESDVICGWARQNYHHAGNQMLRDIIQENVPKYIAAKSKTDKGRVIIAIVEKIRRDSPSGVGLVRQNPKTGRWSFIGVEKAKDKIGHALRKATQEGHKQNKKKAMRKMKLRQVSDQEDSIHGVPTPPSPSISTSKAISYDDCSKQGSRPQYSSYPSTEHPPPPYPPHIHPHYAYSMYPPPPPPPPYHGYHYPHYPYYPPPPPPPPHVVPQYDQHNNMHHHHHYPPMHKCDTPDSPIMYSHVDDE